MTRAETQAERNRRFYRNHPGYYQDRRAASQVLTDSFMSECIDCGNEDWQVLELDHVFGDPERTKQGRRYAMPSNSLTRTMRELAKCEVRCANCHKKRHAMENMSRHRGTWGTVKRSPVYPQLRLEDAA